jgi:RNA polymerase sigma-70 factor (sigma-E family)
MAGSPDRADDGERFIEQLYVERHAETVRLAWALTGDAALAQELAQEAFVRLYVHRRRLRNPAAAPAYLRRTVINLVFTTARRAKRDATVDPGLDLQLSTASGDLVDSRVDVVAALATLAPRRRACVVLRYYLDLNEADTAVALGIKVGTVKSQTHKALLQLREQLEITERATEGEDQPCP